MRAIGPGYWRGRSPCRAVAGETRLKRSRSGDLCDAWRRAGDRPRPIEARESAAALVTEVAFAGEHHGDAVLVGRLDHLAVAHRAARLHHGA